MRGGGDFNVSKIKKYSKAIKELTEKDFISIANDIKSQLNMLSKKGSFFYDLVNEYIYLLNIREALKKDIKEKGVRYKFINGNGKEQEKPNESVVNLIKIEQIMLKLVNDLQINQPFANSNLREKQELITPGEKDYECEEDLL